MHEPQYFALSVSVLSFIVSFWVAKLSAKCFLSFKKVWSNRKFQGMGFFILYLAILIIDAFINYNAILAFLVFVSDFKTGLEDYYDAAAVILAFVYTLLFFGWNMEIAYKKLRE